MNKANFANFFDDSTDGNPLRTLSISLTGTITNDIDNLRVGASKEVLAFLGVAYAASTLPGSPLLHSFGDWDDIAIEVRFPRSYVPDVDTPETRNIIRGDNSRSGYAPLYTPPKYADTDYGRYTRTNIALCPDEDAIAQFNSVYNGRTDWKHWFYNLLAASQVKDLSSRHISSYFASKGTHGIDGVFFASHFPYITAGMMNIVKDDDLRGALEESKWIEYRLTFATTTGLLNKMLTECHHDFIKMFTPATKAIIEDSIRNSWDGERYRRIPTKALAVLYAYLLATGELPSELPGPKRAYDALSLVEKTSLSNFFKNAVKKMKPYKSIIYDSASALPTGLNSI